jgi:hypothetical protein
VVPVISDSGSVCSGGFVPVVSFRLFQVLVHAIHVVLVSKRNDRNDRNDRNETTETKRPKRNGRKYKLQAKWKILKYEIYGKFY